MDASLILVAIVVLVALSFDFINGFHDAANSIATIVATRVLTPQQAVIWAAAFNFIAVFVVGTGVAKTVGSGMIDLKYVTPYVILGGLIGAITWDLITWWFGLPTSSSHALIGGYAGAAMSRVTHLRGLDHCFAALIPGVTDRRVGDRLRVSEQILTIAASQYVPRTYDGRVLSLHAAIRPHGP